VARLRLTDAYGHLHPDVELHLAAPFSAFELAPPPGARSHRGYLRTVREGDWLCILGRVTLGDAEAGDGAFAGYREAPRVVELSGEHGPVLVYDELAYRQLLAWRALPWYKKLSMIVRNR
jgi:hypothetical protein